MSNSRFRFLLLTLPLTALMLQAQTEAPEIHHEAELTQGEVTLLASARQNESGEADVALQASSNRKLLLVARTKTGEAEIHKFWTDEVVMRSGEAIIVRVTDPISSSLHAGLAGAMLHHWRGTAFAPKATAVDFERLMRDFNSYPQHFAPQVVQAEVCSERGNSIEAWIRIRQKHVITVVMDTTYEVTFGQLDIRHGYSISRSTRIDEIASPGTHAEHRQSATEEHGFLWRLNTYWSYEEREGGLYLQIEAVSLTRSIPSGLGWAIGPYIESIPRESMEFTLNSARQALHM